MWLCSESMDGVGSLCADLRHEQTQSCSSGVRSNSRSAGVSRRRTRGGSRSRHLRSAFVPTYVTLPSFPCAFSALITPRTRRFNGHLTGEPGLAGCPLDFFLRLFQMFTFSCKRPEFLIFFLTSCLPHMSLRLIPFACICATVYAVSIIFMFQMSSFPNHVNLSF